MDFSLVFWKVNVRETSTVSSRADSMAFAQAYLMAVKLVLSMVTCSDLISAPSKVALRAN